MNVTQTTSASRLLVIIAFVIVYLVWGSTYFFIQRALNGFPPFILGAFRFLTAGLLLLLYCFVSGEKIWAPKQIILAAIVGFLLLFMGNGGVIWAEQTVPSSWAAVLISAAPLWFVLLDKPKWKENFHSRQTIISLIAGFAGVFLLFWKQVSGAFAKGNNSSQLTGFAAIMVGSICWTAGSLYSKYNAKGSAFVNSAWQMLWAGIIFLPASFISHEWKTFSVQAVPVSTWWSLVYLIFMGSLAAYCAYVWLLEVRPATQVSTYAYVNPVVAVLLGVFFAGEQISLLQITGLGVILASVLLINISKARSQKAMAASKATAQMGKAAFEVE